MKYCHISVYWNDLKGVWQILGFKEENSDIFDVLAEVYKPDIEHEDFYVEYKKEDAETLVSEEIEKIKCGYYIEF